MSEQDWLRAEAPVETGQGAWGGKPAARFELRPLSLGELLDRTMALYRSRFTLFAGIAIFAAAILTVAQGLNLAAAQHMAASQPRHPAPPTMASILLNLKHAGAATAGVYAVLLVYFLVSAVTHAATAWALFRVYLNKPVTARDALRKVLPAWYRWIGIALWQLGSVLWIPLLTLLVATILFVLGFRLQNMGLRVFGGVLFLVAVLAGFPIGVVMYLRNALGIAAAVTEGLEIRPAMRRSKLLSAGSKGRIFMVLFLAACLIQIVNVLQMPLTLLITFSPHQAHYVARGAFLLITFFGQSVVAPVALIGLTLVYIDQRVRREAFDLEILLGNARGEPDDLDAPAGGRSLGPEGYASLG